MTTPFDRKLFLVYWTSGTLPGSSIADVAARVKEKTPNVSGVLLKAITGLRWQGKENSADPKAVTGVRRIEDWVEAFDGHGLEVHVWGTPQGSGPGDVDEEAGLYALAASIPGVRSILLDVEHGQHFWEGTADRARQLMQAIRAEAPADSHIGLILDGRKNRDFGVFVDPFLPFVDSLHPMVYPILFGDHKSIGEHLDEAFLNLAPYDKPIVPMLQAFVETTRRPTPDEITQQAHLAYSKGGMGVSYYRLGDDRASDGLPHMGAPELAAIAAVELPPGPDDVVEPVSYTWQGVINALVTVALRHEKLWQEWFNGSGLAQLWAEPLRSQPYSGPPIIDWPVPELAQRQEILELLGLDPAELARLVAQAREDAKAKESRQVRGAIVGIHGAPGVASPPVHMWDAWIALFKDMGVCWYKQCDNGDPHDVGPGSIFQWVLRLKDEGITPIIRYLQQHQFPNRLPASFLSKMRLYADQGVTWAEIGNEPNLHEEWKPAWHPVSGPGGHPAPRARHTNPEAIRAIAEVWVEDAEAAIKAGVKPAFYAFAPTDWRGSANSHYSSVFFTQKVVQYLAQHHRQRTIDIFNRGGWIAVHAATYEQPLDFDPFGQGSVVWDMTLRSYEVVLKALEDHFGGDVDVDQLVIMSTEGGVFTPDSTSMHNHDRLRSNQEHAERTVEMFKWLEANSPLQAMCPWCISVGPLIGHFEERFRHDGWVEEINGQLSPRPVTTAMRELRLGYERAGKEKILLAIPYISQWDDIAHTHLADCGPTCVAMMVNAEPADRKVTVDALYEHIPHKKFAPKAFTSLREMQTIGAAENLELARVQFTPQAALDRAKAIIEAGHPFVALVNYAKWDDVARNNFRGGHFVVVSGFDDAHVYVHDPLFRGSRRSEGEHYAWTYERFLDGWGGGRDLRPRNPDFVALVSKKTVQKK